MGNLYGLNLWSCSSRTGLHLLLLGCPGISPTRNDYCEVENWQKRRLMNVGVVVKSTHSREQLSAPFLPHGMCDHEWVGNPMLSLNEADPLQVLRPWVSISWRRIFLRASPYHQWTWRARLTWEISEFQRTWGETSVLSHWSKGCRLIKPNLILPNKTVLVIPEF